MSAIVRSPKVNINCILFHVGRACSNEFVVPPVSVIIMDDDEHGDLAQQLAAEAKSAEAKSRGKKGSKKAGQAAKVCFVCPELAMKGKRWCASHNRAYDCMYYQAKSKGEVATLERAMMDAQRAREALDAFMLDNPAEGKWRRKSLIDWGGRSTMRTSRLSETQWASMEPCGSGCLSSMRSTRTIVWRGQVLSKKAAALTGT